MTTLPAAAPGLAARQVDDPARFLAEQLAEGKVVGLFHGRLEAGPRGLGNRMDAHCPALFYKEADVVRHARVMRPAA
ncbi:MAG TPA: carbamoyltransferase C-terminal domain-containing protein [Streptosporangiaceae bacterium]|nr:carbamoyltransferase C-terminal domain-containing protein [Streptosporangiaceae bacterium]